MKKLKPCIEKLNGSFKKSCFPQYFRCLACDIEIFEGQLCADCLERLTPNDGATCPKCGRKTAKSETCIECKQHMPAYDRAVSPLVYKGTAANLIARFKNGHPHVGRYFSELIAEKVKELPKVDGIVYVPMTKKAERKRGYNQAELLADALSGLTGIPVLRGAVQKHKETPTQKNLPRAVRLKNLQNAFKVDKNAAMGRVLLVVDDVMTIGGTLDSMSESLKKAGAQKVFAVTAASVEYGTVDAASIIRK